MYRIEVAPGEETVFRSMEELAVAIRNGVVTPRARIYHNASQKWLPIGLHPHYKKAMELPAASSAHPRTPTPVPAKPLGKLRVESHAAEPHPELQPAPAPKVPAPVVSAVVAMQQEVLRDLPVVEIPEPLPWARRPSPPPPPAPEPPPPPEPVAPIAHAVQAQPTATVTYIPRAQPELVQPELVQPAAEPPAPAQPEPVSPWPHFEPLEETHARPTARRSNRARGRPLLLVGVAAALVFAGHFVLRAAPSASADSTAGAEPEEVVAEPAESALPVKKPVARVTPPPAAATTPPRVTSSPARVRMTPGPAFAGSTPVQPGAATDAPRAKAPPPAATTAPVEPAAADPSIAPAPVELKLALPKLKTDSLAPTRTSDTMAMKKILRALNGSKP
jgi:hypothetical protein